MRLWLEMKEDSGVRVIVQRLVTLEIAALEIAATHSRLSTASWRTTVDLIQEKFLCERALTKTSSVMWLIHVMGYSLVMIRVIQVRCS